MQNILPKNLYLKLISGIAWFAVIAQIGLMMQSDKASTVELIVRFFNYFTILSNLLVAVFATAVAFWPDAGIRRNFSRPATQAAIAVYITVVGLVYNTILRFIWQPTGLQRIVDELLHLVIPTLFVIYWWIFVRQNFKWSAFLPCSGIH